jgi:16S rRNA (uracil1498-N3)-methyltransferase
MTPRCFVEPEEWSKGRLLLSVSDSRHFSTVLRCVPGDSIIVCDGLGGEALCRIAGEEGGCLVAEVYERERQTSSGVMVTLVQAVPKSQKMELIIQKATEIGVWMIVPVMTERGVVKLDGERAEHKRERWQKIAEEAAKQCRAAWVPRVEPIVSIKRLMESGLETDLSLVGSLEHDAVPLRKYLRSREGNPPQSVSLLIGPEGDLSPSELKLVKAKGVVPVSYGDRILRVETAALYGLSVLAYEFPAR